jgi:hypothetical protein
MRFLLKFSVPTEAGNEMIRNPEFPAKLEQWLSDINAEAAYFCPVNGRRGGYIVVNLDDASKIADFAEPLFYMAKAEVEYIPVMLPEDLAKADLEGAIKKWG